MCSRHAPLLFTAFTILMALAIASPPAHAQSTKRAPTPNDTLKSVEVGPDHKVTFRIYAPKANEVSVSGDFGKEGKLTKDDEGVWSVTVGPLTPDFYSYTFGVDGVRTADPKNGRIKPGLEGVASVFEVPGDEAAFEANANVPHGEIRAVWYRSANLDEMRRMHIYTPPGYEGGNARYPVLYLLHGGGDDDQGWSTIGRAGFILDNLVAAQKAVPMLVVMPNGSLPRPANFPRIPRDTPPSPEAIAAREAFQDRFTNELLNEVIPFVEKTYRVNAGPEQRALAGLSMGGGQTLRMLTTHPDQFAYLGIWSAGLFRGGSEAWAERNRKFLPSADTVNSAVRMLSIRVGEEDSALAGTKALADVLEQHHIRHDLQTSGGGHTWTNWRRYLNEMGPKLFR